MKYIFKILLILIVLAGQAYAGAFMESDPVYQAAVTTTPTASKVPLADGTGLIDIGWLPAASTSTAGSMSADNFRKFGYVQIQSSMPVISGGTFLRQRKFGMSADMVRAYAFANNYNVENTWSSTLDSIDLAYKTMYEMGVRHVHEWATPVNFDAKSASGNGALMTWDATDNWSGLDRAIENARRYGMIMTLRLSQPQNTATYDTYAKLVTNWLLPWATYIAQRYEGYTDIISFDGLNECSGNMDALIDVVDIYDACANYQASIYDTVKAVNTNWKVELVSDINERVESILDALQLDGNIAKFDDRVSIHLYPTNLANFVAPNWYSNAGLTDGNTSTITSLISALDTYGRTDVNVGVGEFGVNAALWGAVVTNGSPTVTLDASAPIKFDNVKINAIAGDRIRVVGSSTYYTIQSVDSNVQITLTGNYAGTTDTDTVILIERLENAGKDSLQWMMETYAPSNNRIVHVCPWVFHGSDRDSYGIYKNYVSTYSAGRYADPGYGFFSENNLSLNARGLQYKESAEGNASAGETIVKFRTGLAANLPTYGEVGEPFYLRDTGVLKIGKGINNGFYQFDPSSSIISDTAYNESTWNGVTTIAPSKNAVRDEFELRAPKASPVFTGVATIPAIKPPADAVDAIQIMQADGTTPIVNVDTTNKRLAIGSEAPTHQFHVASLGSAPADRGIGIYQQYDGTGAAVMMFVRSRGTEASPTALAANDYVYAQHGKVYDGTNWLTPGTINMLVDGTVSYGIVPMAISMLTGFDSGTTKIERLRITSQGATGFGITTPTYKVDSKGAVSYSSYSFTGVGLNDAIPGGVFTSTAGAYYVTRVSTTGTPDKVKTKKCTTSCTTDCGAESAEQNMTAYVSYLTLTNGEGAKMSWQANTGHTVDDYWCITTTTVPPFRAQTSAGVTAIATDNDGHTAIGTPVNATLNYLQLDTLNADTAGPPASGDCDASTEVGRSIVSTRYSATAEYRLWVCTQTGASTFAWKYTVLN